MRAEARGEKKQENLYMTNLWGRKTIFLWYCMKNNNGKKMIAFIVFLITGEIYCNGFFL